MLSLEAARPWYPPGDPVHGFEHILRVYKLAERLAQAEGADMEIVLAAALLHDAQDPQIEAGGLGDAAQRESHQHTSARFARRVLQTEGWPAERVAAVEHCILAHRFRDTREQPHSLEAKVLFDADKLDAIGATGAARAIAYAARAGQPFFAPASPGFVETGRLEPGEPHSSYHEYLFKLSRLRDLLHTPSARRIAAERHRFMTDFYERLSTEYDGQM